MARVVLTAAELLKEIGTGKLFHLLEPLFDARQNVLIGTEKVLTAKGINKIMTRFPEIVAKPLHLKVAIPHFIPEDKRVKWTAYLISLFESGTYFKGLPRQQKDFVEKYIKSILSEDDYIIWKLSQIKSFSKKIFNHSVNTGFMSLIVYFTYNHMHFSGMLDAKMIHKIIQASFIHDIGMTLIDLRLAEKNRYNIQDNERMMLLQHAIQGFKLIKSEEEKHEIDREVMEAVMCHEEFVDGTGGPRGISGNHLSFLSRLISLCSYFEYFLSGDFSIRPRPYRDYIGKLRNENEKFDIKLIEALDRSFTHLFVEIK